MITIIFSKNRAMQLELLLHSIKENNDEDLNIHVLYNFSNEKHEKSYEVLSKEYPYVYFHKQSNFKQDLLGLLNNQDYVMFMTDDNVVTNKFNTKEIIALLNSYSEVLGFSLRLGTNTNYCYSLNCYQNMPPSIKLNNHIFMFNWVDAEADYGYAIELSSSIYNIEDILIFLEECEYSNPNELEWALYCNLPWYKNMRPLLMCYEVSPCFCNPINKVNVSNNRSSNNIDFSPDYLLTKFEKCGNISYEPFRGFVSNACHQEVGIDIIYKEK